MRLQDAKAVKAREVVAPVGAKWFAVRSATRRERDLVRALALLGLHAWYPKASYWRRARTQSAKAERPLFPGFVFVLTTDEALHRVHRAERDGFHQIVRCYGLDGMLRPLVLPDVAIGDLLWREEVGHFDDTRQDRARFRPYKGEGVAIIKGKWAGFVARILTVSAKERRVMLDVANLDQGPVSAPFGAIANVDLPEWACAKVESDAVSEVDDRLGQMRQEKLSQRDGPIQPPKRR